MKSPFATVLFAIVFPMTVFGGPRSLAVGPNPESVTRGFGGSYFVSLMGETRTPGDGNGRIVVLEGDSPRTFAGGLDDPKGLVFVGGFLITADFTRVWKIDAAGGKSLLAGPGSFPHPPVYLNDVAVAPDGQSVLVTDMGAVAKMRDPAGKLWAPGSAEARALPAIGRVYRITLDGRVTEVIAANAQMPLPNGVDVLPDGRIRVAEFFHGRILEWSDGVWKTLAEGHRSADAIVHDRKGRFYVTEVFTGKVWRYAADGSSREDLGGGLESAADMMVDEDTGFAVVPDTKRGLLVFLPL